jgi:hypothetical protein
MDVNKHEWLSYFTPRNKQSTRKALLLLFLIAQSQLGLQWMLWAYNWYIKRNAKPFHMYSETTHVQWNHTCTVKPHMYSETTHVQWNHTCTVKPHMYSETTHVQWNHTCIVKPHMYSETTHVQWNHTCIVKPHMYSETTHIWCFSFYDLLQITSSSCHLKLQIKWSTITMKTDIW